MRERLLLSSAESTACSGGTASGTQAQRTLGSLVEERLEAGLKGGPRRTLASAFTCRRSPGQARGFPVRHPEGAPEVGTSTRRTERAAQTRGCQPRSLASRLPLSQALTSSISPPHQEASSCEAPRERVDQSVDLLFLATPHSLLSL